MPALSDIRDDFESQAKEELQKSSWSHVCLRKFISELDLPETMIEAYEQLIPHKFINDEERLTEDQMKEKSVADSFLEVLEREHKRDLTVIVEVCTFLALAQLLDARGIVLVRNLTKYFPGTSGDKIAIEYMLGIFDVFNNQDYIVSSLNAGKTLFVCDQELQHTTTRRSRRKKYIRYAQIGAVSVGAGK
jgi:hypothetical protein